MKLSWILFFVLTLSFAANETEGCKDSATAKQCKKWLEKGKCSKKWAAEKCPKTCNICTEDCEDTIKAKTCLKWKNKGKCSKKWATDKCPKTCGICTGICEDTGKGKQCLKWKNKGKCSKKWAADKCPKTCGLCDDGSPPSSSSSYTQDWLRGDTNVVADPSHVHEGLRLAAGDGWVGVGGTYRETYGDGQVIVRKINNEGTIQWTATFGDSDSSLAYSVGFGIAEGGSNLYVAAGLWQKSSNQMKPAILALDSATGNLVWTRVLSSSQPNHGGARGVIVDGNRIICTGYVNSPEPGFLFVSDESTPAVWELDLNGNVVKEKFLSIEGLGQGAKIRKDHDYGYVLASTAWAQVGGQDVESVAVVKLYDSLNVRWSKMFGMAGGSSQCFDLLVDNDGNYLMGGHTTVGTGVVNWDYLALKVNSQTQAEEWRRTYGQPRGFDANYIHDEMYGVALDPAGNYLLLGGSGDEYTYSATNSSSPIPSSDTWVSFLVAVDTQGNTLMEGIYGAPGANNAGEYLSVDMNSGVVMIYTDSDSINGGFGFLKLSPA